MSIPQVCFTLGLQTMELRYLSSLQNGRLKYFRRALELERFPDVVRIVKGKLGCHLFSTLEEVESMEASYRDGRGFELIVQCCVVVELEVLVGLFEDGPALSQKSSLFRQCRTLEDIAHLRTRLNFIREPTNHQKGVELDLFEAVQRCMTDTEVTWEGMLLVLSVARPTNRHWIFSEFSQKLGDELNKIPKAAASLFLSYASDAFEHDRNPEREEMIFKLLRIGGSPLVSIDEHEALFKVLQRNHPRAGGESWVPDRSGFRYRMTSQGPTALSRIVEHEPSTALLEELSQHVCCNLDSDAPCSRIFPKKVPKLACLAGRLVGDSDMDTLPARMRFTILKHRPLS